MSSRQPNGLIGSTRRMREVREQLRSLAPVPWPVRIEGPSGSGKSVAARLLHEWSPLASGPFVSCNVGMIASGLEIGELVGHARGAITGAVSDRVGVFEAAHGGTLFLDEIGTASPTVQRALLQLIEEGSVRRLGEHRERQVRVRLVFATNADLEAAVLAGDFRVDLLHRLGLLIVKMPSLARHREDIPALANEILAEKALEKCSSLGVGAKNACRQDVFGSIVTCPGAVAHVHKSTGRGAR